MSHQRAVDLIGNADAASLGKGSCVLIGEHRAPDAGGAATSEGTFAVNIGEHVLEHRVEENRLEVLRRGAGLCLLTCPKLGGIHAVGENVDRLQAGRRHGEGCVHYITSMSAWIAPEALIACRIAIRSRGPIPSELSPSTSCCSDTPSFTTASFLPSSWTPMRVRGTTRVFPPRLNGSGWLTSGLSLMVTVRLPCATATIETRTSRPMTIIPERSSIMILAPRSGSICNCSTSVSSETTLPRYCWGTVMPTVAGSSGSAVGAPI